MSLMNIASVGAQGITNNSSQIRDYLTKKTSVKRSITDIKSPDGKIFAPNFTVQVWLEEHHHDQVEITQHPVEFGAMITDHAFKHPAEVVLELGWSNSPTADSGLLSTLQGVGVANSPLVAGVSEAYNLFKGAQSLMNGAGPEQVNSTYDTLVKIQEKMCTFTLQTGKRKYYNMAIKSMTTETDSKSANSMIVNLTCQQILLVNTKTVKLVAGKQAPATAKSTTTPVDTGTKSPIITQNLLANYTKLL